MAFTTNPITVISQRYAPSEKLDSFADTNALLEYCDRYCRPFIHFWTTESPTLILGINDRHLPNLPAALHSLRSHQYDHFLRNSGGLAVISDPGILNISLFIPDPNQEYSVDSAYEMIANLMKQTFPTLTIATYEIVNSYCPGKFDLSVNGQKIAGIAQRRTRNAIVLMLYLSVNGDQNARSRTVADFYTAGNAYSQDRWHFPEVDPGVMTTVADLGFPEITNSAVEEKFLTSVSRQDISLDMDGQAQLARSESFKSLFQQQLRKIQLRNDQLPTI